MVAEPGVAPGIEDYESSVMLFHYPATGCFFSLFFPKMRSQFSSNFLRGTLSGLGLLPLPLMLCFSKLDYALECLLLKIPFDLQEPCDSSTVYVHGLLAHKAHTANASLLPQEYAIP